jgi:putative aldouronate transport system permease protein
MPIILALLINYTTFPKLRKIAQTVTYAPFLISTVVMVGMLLAFLDSNGVINQFLGLLGIAPVRFIGNSSMFQSIYVWSDVWQKIGWNSIIYIAVLVGVNQELHEAATVDGANKLQRIWHIDLVTLLPTAVVLLIMNLGSVMNIGFEKVYLMQNNMNLGVSEIISTYVYKVGIQGAQYSYATAIGLFNNIINFILLVIVNRAARIFTGNSLW